MSCQALCSSQGHGLQLCSVWLVGPPVWLQVRVLAGLGQHFINKSLSYNTADIGQRQHVLPVWMQVRVLVGMEMAGMAVDVAVLQEQVRGATMPNRPSSVSVSAIPTCTVKCA